MALRRGFLLGVRVVAGRRVVGDLSPPTSGRLLRSRRGASRPTPTRRHAASGTGRCVTGRAGLADPAGRTEVGAAQVCQYFERGKARPGVLREPETRRP